MGLQNATGRRANGTSKAPCETLLLHPSLHFFERNVFDSCRDIPNVTGWVLHRCESVSEELSHWFPLRDSACFQGSFVYLVDIFNIDVEVARCRKYLHDRIIHSSFTLS